MTTTTNTIDIAGNCTAAIIANFIDALPTLPEGRHVTLVTPLGKIEATRNGTYITVFPLDAAGHRGDTGRKRGHQGAGFHTLSTADMQHALNVVLNRARRMT